MRLSTLALPWIIADGKLRPSADGFIGNRRYLWATRNPVGEKTSLAIYTLDRNNTADETTDELYQYGQAQLIRFTLPDRGFIPWQEFVRTPTFTKRERARLAKFDSNKNTDHKNWCVLPRALPLSSVLKVEAKLYGDDWRPIKATKKNCIDVSDDPPTKGFTIDNVVFYSRIIEYRDGLPNCWVPDRDELTAMWEERLDDEYS